MERLPSTKKTSPLSDVAMGVVCLVFLATTVVAVYVGFLRDRWREERQLQAKLQQKEAVLAEVSRSEEDHARYLKEIGNLANKLEPVESQIPYDFESVAFLDEASQAIEALDLKLERFEQLRPSVGGEFDSLPVRLTVRGNFNQVQRLLEKLAVFARIVHVADLNLQVVQNRDPTAEPILQAQITAELYRANHG